MNTQHLYEVRPRKDKRGFDLVSDTMPFSRLRYGEHTGSAKPPSLRLLRAKAKEEEAETL